MKIKDGEWKWVESRGSERRYLFISTSLLTLIYCVYISYVVGVLDGTPSWCSYTADPPPNKNFRQMFNKAYICRQMYSVEQNVRQKHKSVDKICFCRTNVRQIAYSCRQKFRQNTFLAGHWSGKVPTKHIFVDKNMLCWTKFRQNRKLSTKYALSDILPAKICFVGHFCWTKCPAKSYCRQIYAFRAGRPRRPGCPLAGPAGRPKIILSTNICFPGRQA